MVKAKAGIFASVAAIAAGSLLLAACGGGGGSTSSSGAPTSSSGPAPTKGGTIYLLTVAEDYDTLDPQIMYTGEDLALFGATMFRTLTAYKISPDNTEGTTLTPDMATDTGRVSNGGKTWEFTLKDGIKFETGAVVGCADIKYGVSRTFDQEITGGGPTYAISYLDVPEDAEGNSTYKGPFSKDPKNDVAGFDKAIVCSADNKTITFNLKQPVPDFNYTVTLAAFAPVPKAQDTGLEYTKRPISSGPYKIGEYTSGKGGKLTLVRNDQWDPASDTYRAALPDVWETDFGLSDTVIDERLIASTGVDETALNFSITTANLSVVFDDEALANRRVNNFDPYTRYLAVNVAKVPNLKVRQAIGVALDREALRLNAGGKYAGDFADGAVKPNIGADYAPTNLWDGLLGQPVPATGDPEFAKKLLAESGETNVSITYDYAAAGGDADRAAAIVKSSLELAGISVKLNPIEPGQYYGVIFKGEHELMGGGWGPDWPNASTVIPPLYTLEGGWDLSQVDDPDFNAKVKAAQVELDRAKQATMWQELNTYAASQMWIVPTRFGLEQRLAGTKVGPVFIWPAYGSWPYASMGVTQ
jgi:peptide/nickel transport system substrate-binding protein